MRKSDVYAWPYTVQLDRYDDVYQTEANIWLRDTIKYCSVECATVANVQRNASLRTLTRVKKQSKRVAFFCQNCDFHFSTKMFSAFLPSAGHAGERFHFFNLSSFGREEKMIKAEFRWFRKKQKFYLGKSHGPHFYKVRFHNLHHKSCAHPYLTSSI